MKVDGAALAVLAALISWWGSGLPHPGMLAMEAMNIWFDSDIPRVWLNMTVLEYGHSGSFKHPLFSILLWPLTAGLTFVTGDAFVSARLILAANAALSVVLLWAIAGRLGLGRLDRALVCGLFIASAAFAFWHTMLETFPFGGTTILAGLFAGTLALDGRSRSFAMVLCGAAALSMTITNFAVFGLALLVGLRLARPEEPLLALVRRAVPPVAITLFICAVIAVVQDRIFGEAGLFFNPIGIFKERQFIFQADADPMWIRPAILFLGSMVYGGAVLVDFVFPMRGAEYEVVKLDYLAFGPVSGLSGAAMIAATVAWVPLLAWSLLAIPLRWGALLLGPVDAGDGVEARSRAVIGLSALSSALAFLALHMIYGAEVFLYIAHLAPLLAVIAACGLALSPSRVLRGLAAAAILFMAVRNYAAFPEALAMAASANF